MEVQSRRSSNYSLLSQFDNHAADQSPPQPPKQLLPLQRQSSGGSSFADSSLSGGNDYYAPSITSAPIIGGGGGVGGGGGGEGEVGEGKSWAQQTEESYQLQLALALRLSAEAACADDPNFLDPVEPGGTARAGGDSEAVAHRFWVNGCLSYSDKVPDGFYLIHGMDPYVWTICIDLQEGGRIPSIESLKSVDPKGSAIEVVLFDRRNDSSLKELLNRAQSIPFSCDTMKDVVDQLAKLVCYRMGGAVALQEQEISQIWKDSINNLKNCLGSVILPIGSLCVGLCRHRALLFKVLADTVDLPCRIAKGCKYCARDDAASCLVRFSLDREYLVDLVGKPGYLCDPDSLLNGPASISISSPLRFPRYRPVEPAIDYSSLAKQYFSDCQSLNLVFEKISAGAVFYEDAQDIVYDKPSDAIVPERKASNPMVDYEASVLQLPSNATQAAGPGRDSHMFEFSSPPQNISRATNAVKETVAPSGQKGFQQYFPFSRGVVPKDNMLYESNQKVPLKTNRDIDLDMEDLDIPWSDLILKERIGAGSFGTVHRAEWHGSEVAVKILMEQDLHGERFKEFIREVAIMKRLRHPNIVLFMGAVTQPPNLSIVTEYLSRGSLFRLLHRPGAREVLDEKRRLNMAYDVAKGMNYLHKRNPPIVHRDLKSPNLLVDKKYTVKVCDFGLSRLKVNTFLSSKSSAGTPEWMAPEVLKSEESNEKSDIYSFGVILWELATLQQPWGNLNPAQVVAAVAFKDKRLEIPHDVNPQVAAIIEACWANDPSRRPSFASIMESLRPLIKPRAPQPAPSDVQL
ncbi:hypothetical protein Drorol1_Dr00013847 [Drosera rotundifolia]